MALTISYTLKNEFGFKTTLPESYCRVSSISGGKGSTTINVEFLTQDKSKVYTSKMFFFTPTFEGKNFIAQAYDYLKTLPEFEGATDC